ASARVSPSPTHSHTRTPHLCYGNLELVGEPPGASSTKTRTKTHDPLLLRNEPPLRTPNTERQPRRQAPQSGRWSVPSTEGVPVFMQLLSRLTALAALLLLLAVPARAEVDNLRIVTDASPDYHDMDGLVHSITSRWKTPEE